MPETGIVGNRCTRISLQFDRKARGRTFVTMAPHRAWEPDRYQCIRQDMSAWAIVSGWQSITIDAHTWIAGVSPRPDADLLRYRCFGTRKAERSQGSIERVHDSFDPADTRHGRPTGRQIKYNFYNSWSPPGSRTSILAPGSTACLPGSAIAQPPVSSNSALEPVPSARLPAETTQAIGLIALRGLSREPSASRHRTVSTNSLKADDAKRRFG